MQQAFFKLSIFIDTFLIIRRLQLIDQGKKEVFYETTLIERIFETSNYFTALD